MNWGESMFKTKTIFGVAGAVALALGCVSASSAAPASNPAVAESTTDIIHTTGSIKVSPMDESFTPEQTAGLSGPEKSLLTLDLPKTVITDAKTGRLIKVSPGQHDTTPGLRPATVSDLGVGKNFAASDPRVKALDPAERALLRSGQKIEVFGNPITGEVLTVKPAGFAQANLAKAREKATPQQYDSKGAPLPRDANELSTALTPAEKTLAASHELKTIISDAKTGQYLAVVPGSAFQQSTYSVWYGNGCTGYEVCLLRGVPYSNLGFSGTGTAYNISGWQAVLAHQSATRYNEVCSPVTCYGKMAPMTTHHIQGGSTITRVIIY